MEDLPESLVLEIFSGIREAADRNSLSLVNKRFHAIEADQRASLRVGCGLHPATESLTSLCLRFPNLKKLEIVYSGWISNLGKQLDNEGLRVVASHCPSLTELTLSFCSFINDTGLRHLSSSRNLRSFTLDFAPAISANGILTLVVGCKNLSTLHLIHCVKVSSIQWLEYLGNAGNLEDLAIKNCRAIGEDDLLKLGRGWMNLKRLKFEVDGYYRYPKVYDVMSSDWWRCCRILCDDLKELILVNCIMAPARGLSSILSQCRALERLKLDMCIGVKDSDIAALSNTSSNLRAFSLRLPSQYLAQVAAGDRLTDNSLRALAHGCPKIAEVELTFADGEFPSFPCFSLAGLLSLMESCRVRTLSLRSAYFFNDTGMAALGSAAPVLESLELAKCQEVGNEGIQLVKEFNCLKVLKLCKCLGVSDEGMKELKGSQKLEALVVEDCPRISMEGVRGVARSVVYKQDLSWLY